MRLITFDVRHPLRVGAVCLGASPSDYTGMLEDRSPDGRGSLHEGRGTSGLHRAGMVGNTHPGRPAGQCNRKQTAQFRLGKGETVV